MFGLFCSTYGSFGYFASKKESNTSILNFVQLATAAILSIFLFLIFDGDFSQLAPKISILSILYLAVFSTTIAYFIQSKAQKYVSASRVGVILATESLFATIFSIILKYDVLSSNLVIGGIIILAAVIIAEL